MKIHSVQGKGVECQGYSLSFRIGNGVFSDTFYVNKDMDFSRMFDGPFIGIIGHEFLMKNNIVLELRFNRNCRRLHHTTEFFM